MPELSVATTINPRFDHVTPIEMTQSSVTITHRCHVFAELMAVARSGLVDIVLIADDFELVGLETLEQVLDAQGHGPKVAAISDVVDDRQRLGELGIPIASPAMSGPELVQWLRDTHQQDRRTHELHIECSSHELEILEQLDPDTPPKRRRGRRAAPYDPTTDLPEQAAAPTALPLADDQELSDDGVDIPDSVEHAEDFNAIFAPDEDATTLRDSVPSNGRLTAVWGPLGAPGVTTIAVNLAVESTLAGHRTLLIDANTYGAAVAVHLGLLDDTAAIAQACRAIEHRGSTAVKLNDYVQSVNIQGARLDVMTGLTRSERWPQLRTAAWQQLLDLARIGWDYVIVDCGFGLEEDEELSFDIPAPQRNATTTGAVRAADTILAVGAGDPVGLGRFMKALEHLVEVSPQQIVPVVNKVSSITSGVGPKRQLAAVWERFGPKLSLQHFIPWAPDITAAALLEGKTLAERAPKAEVRQAIRTILGSCGPAIAEQVTRRHAGGRTKSQWSLRGVVAQVRERAGRRQ